MSRSKMFAANDLAEHLGLERDNKEANTKVVLDYVEKTIKVDDRRLMWILERAANHTAGVVQSLEESICVCTHAGRTKELPRLRESMERHIEDFRFQYALWMLSKGRVFESFGAEVAEFVGKRRPAKKP